MYTAHRKYRNRSGWSFDNKLSIVTTSDEVLKEAILADPAVKLARTPFAFYNECEFLWSGTVATGSAVIQPVCIESIESPTIVSDCDDSVSMCSDFDQVTVPRPVKVRKLSKHYQKKAKNDDITTLQNIIKMFAPAPVPAPAPLPTPAPVTESDARQLIAWASEHPDISQDQSASVAFFLLNNPNAAHLAMSFKNNEARICFIRKMIPDF
jgi:hypothetical protein